MRTQPCRLKSLGIPYEWNRENEGTGADEGCLVELEKIVLDPARVSQMNESLFCLKQIQGNENKTLPLSEAPPLKSEDLSILEARKKLSENQRILHKLTAC